MQLPGNHIIIIGGGPAGLAAAIKAKETGAENVTIIERAENLGGLLHQCVHNGFGLLYFKEDMTGPEFGYKLIEKATDLKVNLCLETMALCLNPDLRITICNKKGLFTQAADAIVLAMGCREKTREMIMVPGTRPAGIFTAGQAQRFVNVEGFLPGEKIVILGSGDVGLIMARRLTLEGAEVKCVVEIMPYVGGLVRNEVQCLIDFDIPLLLEHTITEIHGRDRVEAVTLAKVDGKQEPIPGTEKLIDCDTVLISVGLIPENELSVSAGVKLNPITGGPAVNEKMMTNIQGIFAAGNVVHIHDLVDNVVLESELAGAYAFEYAMGKRDSDKQWINIIPGEGIKYVVPNAISLEKNVSLYTRVTDVAQDVSIEVGDILQKSLRAVRPSEMVKIELSEKELGKINKEINELVVSCRRKKS